MNAPVKIPLAAKPAAAAMAASTERSKGPRVEAVPRFLLDIPTARHGLGGMSTTTLRLLIKYGDLPAVRIGKSLYLRPQDLEAWCAAGCPCAGYSRAMAGRKEREST